MFSCCSSRICPSVASGRVNACVVCFVLWRVDKGAGLSCVLSVAIDGFVGAIATPTVLAYRPKVHD